MDPAQLIFAAVEAGTLARRDDALPGGADDVYVSLLKHLHKTAQCLPVGNVDRRGQRAAFRLSPI